MFRRTANRPRPTGPIGPINHHHRRTASVKYRVTATPMANRRVARKARGLKAAQVIAVRHAMVKARAEMVRPRRHAARISKVAAPARTDPAPVFAAAKANAARRRGDRVSAPGRT